MLPHKHTPTTPSCESSPMLSSHVLNQIHNKNKKNKSPIIENKKDDMSVMYNEYTDKLSKFKESVAPKYTNEPDSDEMGYATLPAWADPSSPEYNPVKFLAEWANGPERFINGSGQHPIVPSTPVNWLQKMLAFFGLGDGANRVKLEKIRSEERIRLKELEMASNIAKDCKKDIHQCSDWKFVRTIEVYGAHTKYPVRFDNIYSGTCKHCGSPVVKKTSF